MTRRAAAGAATSFLVAGLLALACVVLTAATARAASLPVQVSFDNLLPGEVRSTSWPVNVPAPARIATATVLQAGSGGVRWTARLCPAAGGGCVDLLSAATGTALAQGDYSLQVGVSATDLQPGQTRTLEARYTLVEVTDGWLADTGGQLAMTGVPASALGLTAVGLAGLGWVLVVVARRRRAAPADGADGQHQAPTGAGTQIETMRETTW